MAMARKPAPMKKAAPAKKPVPKAIKKMEKMETKMGYGKL